MTDQESLLAAIDEDVQLRPHDPAWTSAFQAERDRLDALLPATFIGIEHIGSTAIPGLLAKPVVDILAGVGSMAIAAGIGPALLFFGYTTSAEFNASLLDRQWFMRWADGHRTHHLHVVVHEGAVWNERLRFRDLLCTRPGLAAAYADLKRRLAAEHRGDREAYTDAKASFVRAALNDV